MIPKRAAVDSRSFSSDQSLVDEVACQLVSLVRERLSLRLALSGGRIVQPLFDAVVRESQRLSVDWSAVRFFWADERCVPPDHAASNYRLAKNHLLVPLGISRNRVHRIRGEIEPATAASEGEEQLRRALAGDPGLDLVLLGMGEDGHVASIFPGAPEEPPGRLYLPVTGPKPPSARITLTLLSLINARRAWVVVAGQDKAATLQRALAGDPHVPLARVIAQRDRTQVFASVAGSPEPNFF